MAFDKEMQKALEADGEKLRQLTGEDHGPRWSVDCTDCGGEGVYFNCIDGCCEDAELGCDECETTCSTCEGKGYYYVTQLTDDNYDRAVLISNR